MKDNGDRFNEGPAERVGVFDMKVLMSACLAGVACTYDGGTARDLLTTTESVHMVCPELLGGLATPRARAEIVGGDGFDVLDGNAKVVTETGQDVTGAYVAGAYRVLTLAQELGCRVAVLQDFSPSCGSTKVNDGSFRKARVRGVGVAAALLARNGVVVVPHHQYAQRFPREISSSDNELRPGGDRGDVPPWEDATSRHIGLAGVPDPAGGRRDAEGYGTGGGPQTIGDPQGRWV
jgi:uncharacterized protein YbbK (DUF523 family)